MRSFSPGLIKLAFAAALLVPVVAAAQPPRGDRELGAHLSSECVTCHQASGRSVGGIPAIVGWPEDQFFVVMESYKHRVRENETMRAIAARLSDEEIAALAAYFGALTPQQ